MDTSTNLQKLSSSLPHNLSYLFLSFLSPFAAVTGNYIGAIETILATAWVGVTYSLIGGMPLVSRSENLFFRLNTNLV